MSVDTYEVAAQAVADYAKDHYESDGWDYIVECWSVAEIREELVSRMDDNIRSAIAWFGTLAKTWDERRKDAEGEVF